MENPFGTAIRSYYLLVAAAVGAAVMALEVWAARAIAPALGSGSASWSVLLAAALGMLAIGNLLGGRLSGLVGPNAVIVYALSLAAIDLTVLSQVYGRAMRWSADQPYIIGEILAALVILAVPMTMLGLVTPVLLHHGQGGTGRWAGAVLAAGSGGGIAGALAAGLFLVPTFGLARSLLSIAGALVLAAAPALWPERRRTAALLLLAASAAVVACWGRQAAGRAVESRYGQLEVRSNALYVVLHSDGMPQTGMPQQLRPGDALRYGYLLELALQLRPDVRKALVVGLGGGLAPRVLDLHGVECESIEIDPAVVEIARRDFGFTGRVTVADGRAVLAQRPDRYDLIFLDACTADRLAWHLFTVEAMRIVRDRLAPGGLLAIQFIGDDGPWSASLARTVEAAFHPLRGELLSAASSHRSVGPRWLFIGRDGSLSLPSERDSPDPRPSHAAVSDGFRRRPSWKRIARPEGGLLLFDDHFPAERAWSETARQWRGLCTGRM